MASLMELPPAFGTFLESAENQDEKRANKAKD
jgi:hypothetical protein